MVGLVAMTSASSVKSSSPINGSSAAADHETARDAMSDKVDSQEMSGLTGPAGTMQRTSSFGNSTGSGGSDQLVKAPNQDKLQALKQRKCDLEKLLNEKNIILDQIQRQEQQIISGDYIFDTSFLKTNSLNLRKKISTTSFKLPSNKGKPHAKERSGSVGDMEKKLRQEIIEAQAHNLPNMDASRLKAVLGVAHKEYEPVALSIPQQQKVISKRHSSKEMEGISRSSHVGVIDPGSAVYQQSLARTQALSVVDMNRNAGAKLMSHSPVPSLANQSHRCSPILVQGVLHGGGKYSGRLNTTNNYCTTERRNSLKSIYHQKGNPSPRLYRQEDRFTVPVNVATTSVDYPDAPHPTCKVNRVDYDQSHCVMSPQPSNTTNKHLDYEADRPATHLAGYVGGFIADAADPMGQMMRHAFEGPLNSNRMSSISVPGYSVGTNNGKMVDSALASRYSQLTDHEDTPYSHQRMSTLSGRKSANLHMELGPKPIYSTKSYEDDQLVGLGGFWKTLGNERIWCTVDTSYDSSSVQQTSKPKKSNIANKTTPVKSLSLGNFDMLNDTGSREELVDRISISSMNSEGNKKPKEKQWLETSLDGPTPMQPKQSNQSMGAFSPGQHLHTSQQDPSLPVNTNTNLMLDHITGTPQLSPTQHPKLVAKHGSNVSNYNNSRKSDANPQQQARKAVCKAPWNVNYGGDFHVPHPGQEQICQPIDMAADSMPIAEFPVQPAALDAASLAGAISLAKPRHLPTLKNQCPPKMLMHQQRPNEQIQQETLPPPGATPLNITATNNPRSPINAINFQHDLIRIESPKNMTVVQQAVFMPYKEVTKPFEMSDFYKYSTKFRQREKNQQPQPNQVYLQQQVEVEQ